MVGIVTGVMTGGLMMAGVAGSNFIVEVSGIKWLPWWIWQPRVVT